MPNPRNSRPIEGPSPWPVEHLPLRELRSFVREVLCLMVARGDIASDARGRSVAMLRASGEDSRCSFLHLMVDLSAIGLPRETHLGVYSHRGDTFLSWHLGKMPLAQTPKGMKPREAAAVLCRDCLLEAHRRLLRAEEGRG